MIVITFAEIISNSNFNEVKERLFKIININIVINGISRSIVLELDMDWMNAIRKIHIDEVFNINLEDYM